MINPQAKEVGDLKSTKICTMYNVQLLISSFDIRGIIQLEFALDGNC